MGSGFGAGAGADMLQDVLRRKFAEVFAQQKLNEDMRQADMQNRVQQAQLGQGQQRIGLEGERLGQEQKQFETSSGQAAQRLGMEQELQPVRIKQMQAQTEDLNRQPQDKADTRAFREKELGLEHTNRMGEINATGANALRVQQARPAATMVVPTGDTDASGAQVQKVVPKTVGTTFAKPDAITAQTRQMGETAKAILPHIQQVRDEAAQLDKAGLLGPIGGRWRDFVAGKIGSGQLAGGNPEAARLIGKFQADIGLLQTAVARAHAGARGAGNVTLLQHMEKMMPGTSADFPTFSGSLDAVQGWMKTYADDVNPKGKSEPAAGAPNAADLIKKYGG